MNILFVLEYYPPHVGGAEFLFERIALGLAERGHSVKVLTMRLPNTKRHETRGGVEIDRVKVPFDSRSLFSIWTIPRAISMARWADVIHTSTYNAIPPASIAGTITRTPVLVTGHERRGTLWFSLPRISKLKATLLYLAEHILYRFPSALIAAVSDASRRDIIAAGIPARKVTRIYNAFDETPWTRDPEARAAELAERYATNDRTVVLVYGRPGITKGIEYAIRAFPRIKQELPNAVLLVIVSTRPESGYAMITREIDAIGREHVIERNDVAFSDLPAHVSLADVVIVPSLTEGFGYTTLEASTLEKRIVASNAGAIPEVISGRYELVAPANPDAIAHAAVRLIKRSPEPVPYKRFPVSETIAAYEAAYERITRARGTR